MLNEKIIVHLTSCPIRCFNTFYICHLTTTHYSRLSYNDKVAFVDTPSLSAIRSARSNCPVTNSSKLAKQVCPLDYLHGSLVSSASFRRQRKGIVT